MPTRAGAGEATVTAVNVVIGGARGRGRRAVEGGGLWDAPHSRVVPLYPN